MLHDCYRYTNTDCSRGQCPMAAIEQKKGRKQDSRRQSIPLMAAAVRVSDYLLKYFATKAFVTSAAFLMFSSWFIA